MVCKSISVCYAYVRMCSAISRIVSNKNDLKDNIKRVAKAINFIVFNKYEDGIRNTASKDELNDIIAIENVIASVIDDGFIKDYNSLINGKENGETLFLH